MYFKLLPPVSRSTLCHESNFPIFRFMNARVGADNIFSRSAEWFKSVTSTNRNALSYIT